MVREPVAGGIPKADGIMERAGGLFYGDDTGGVPEIHWLFLVYPGLVAWFVVTGILFLFGYLEYDFAKPGCPISGGYGYLFVGKCENTLQGIWSGICDIAAGAFELLKNVIFAPVLLLIDLVTGNFSQLASDAANIWNNIRNAASQIWSGIRQAVTSAASGLKQGVETVLSALSQFASQIWSAMKQTASSVWNGIKTTVVNIASHCVKRRCPPSSGWSPGSALPFPGCIPWFPMDFLRHPFITGLPGQAFQWGKDFIQGLINGISSMIQSVINTVSGLADRIRSFLHFSAPDEGPLADYETWMPDFMKGLASGIEKNRNLVEKAVRDVASEMVISPKVNGMSMAIPMALYPVGICPT